MTEEQKQQVSNLPTVRIDSDPGAVIQRSKEASGFVLQHLEKGTAKDYGEIPGTQNLVLFKRGAERLLMAFGLSPRYEITGEEIDHDRENEYVKYGKDVHSYGLYRYQVRCTLVTREGAEVGSSMGSCSTMESKYISRPRDCENTVLKMAQKRALVSAVISVFGIDFTADLEDTQEAASPGYEPNNPHHVQKLEKVLTSRKVSKNLWPQIKEKMTGKAMDDLDGVIKGASAAPGGNTK